MARLAAYVHVIDENGAPFVFCPDSVVPAWAEKAITNPKAWAEAPEEPTGYAAKKVPELEAEIAQRNEGRDEADLIKPDGSKKADLVAALEADDQKS